MEYLSHYVSDDDDEDDNNNLNKNQNNLITSTIQENNKNKDKNNTSNNKNKRPIESINNTKNNSTNNNNIDDIPDIPLSLFEYNNKRIINTSNNNNKRIRVFEHVEGNYPSFIFIKIPNYRNDILNIINQVKEIGIEIGIKEELEDYHISLSKTFPMREHHIESFSNELRKTLKNQRSFSIKFANYCCTFINENQSRIFLSIPLDLNFKNSLLKLIERVDNCLSLFKFPVFYNDPEPHLSIVSDLLKSNDNQDNEIQEKLGQYKNKEVIQNIDNSEIIEINKIYWSIGKYEYNIELQ